MRIKNTIETISYHDTQDFFDRRAKKYKEDNPYSVTMYQDDHPDLVKMRNKKETEKLLPKLHFNKSSKILDIACGIGRWSDAITVEIQKYCGIDFCSEFIKLAQQRNQLLDNRKFLVGKSTDVVACLEKAQEGNFNRILLIGALIYLNDNDLSDTLSQIGQICEQNTIICIREPIGLKERLTLKKQFSEELEDTYNAIYRTRDELITAMETAFFQKGFLLDEELPV